METEKLIRDARANGQTSLNEADSKRLLAPFGIPVVEERVAGDAAAAVREARSIGFPVALKGLGARLSHKTERGLVRLNLMDTSAVEAAAAEMAAEAADDLEGFLVQPMVPGRRELVAGLLRDRDFGPVVMLGLIATVMVQWQKRTRAVKRPRPTPVSAFGRPMRDGSR